MTGDDFPVDAPDTFSVVGVLRNGAEVSWQVASVPHHASGIRMEVYGRKGTLVLTSKSVNTGPSQPINLSDLEVCLSRIHCFAHAYNDP